VLQLEWKILDLCVEPIGFVASDMHKCYIFRMPDARENDLKTSHTSYFFPWNVSSTASRAGESTDDYEYATGLSFLCIEAYRQSSQPTTALHTSQNHKNGQPGLFFVLVFCRACACACAFGVRCWRVVCWCCCFFLKKNTRNIRNIRIRTKDISEHNEQKFNFFLLLVDVAATTIMVRARVNKRNCFGHSIMIASVVCSFLFCFLFLDFDFDFRIILIY
jgi:hypothetical protein